MSLFGSLFSGVSGLTAQSQAMGMISDNVANVNTVSYKGAAPKFSTLVTRSAAVSTYSPGGARANTLYRIDQQGLLQGSNSPTDVAIDGAGFFVVNSRPDATGDQLYTRAGSFEQDFLGNLRNNAGFYLQGWALDASEQVININQLSTVNVRMINGVAAATTNVELGANLDAGQTPFAGAYAAGDMAAFNATGGVGGAQPHMVARGAGVRSARRRAQSPYGLPQGCGREQLERRSLRRSRRSRGGEPPQWSARQRHRHLQWRRYAYEHQHHAQLSGGRGRGARSASTGSTPAGLATARSRSILAPSAPPTASVSSRATTTSRS